jgi:predicted lipid-binding transport protein (Tim44 family)
MRIRGLSCLVFLAVTWTALPAIARPGGGHTYSSPSTSSPSSSSSSSRSSYSSSGSSSGGVSGIGLIIIVAVAIVGISGVLFAAHGKNTWDSSRSSYPIMLLSGMQTHVTEVRGDDPDFSLAAFEDFAYQLYAAAYRAASDPAKLAALAPYLSPAVIARLRRMRVEQVVVGSISTGGIKRTAEPFGSFGSESSGPPARHRIAVNFEANLATDQGTLARIEHWVFTRAIGVATRAPTAVQTWPCPRCGAPWSTAAGGDPRRCGHCGEDTGAGRFGWTVEQIWIEKTGRAGKTLTGTVEEVGTDQPTRYAPDVRDQLAALRAADPEVTEAALAARIRLIHRRVNEAWNALDLTTARGLVTRSMLDYLRYWIDEYRRQRVANRLEGAALHDIQLVKLVRDRHYDAITARLFAEGVDYTIDEAGAVVGGSRTAVRRYSEYWTLLRAASRRGKVTDAASCPNCGAPLAISDSGTCTHCSAEIESGGFDWVLSKIEQDEAYRG